MDRAAPLQNWDDLLDHVVIAKRTNFNNFTSKQCVLPDFFIRNGFIRFFFPVSTSP